LTRGQVSHDKRKGERLSPAVELVKLKNQAAFINFNCADEGTRLWPGYRNSSPLIAPSGKHDYLAGTRDVDIPIISDGSPHVVGVQNSQAVADRRESLDPELQFASLVKQPGERGVCDGRRRSIGEESIQINAALTGYQKVTDVQPRGGLEGETARHYTLRIKKRNYYLFSSLCDYR